ncbi:MAG: glycosyltransferase [Lachnospiraceae bacterium]|nr:glycosyltransferase [Lachnospiraceae bacterium]
MANPIRLCGRGLRYLRQYGPAQLYYKIKERRDRDRAERGYDTWLSEKLPGEQEEKEQRETIFSKTPCISILVPAYETPEKFLRQMIESVLGQSYENVELCIADGSSSEKVRQVAEEYARQDHRLRYEKLRENKGISENTNAALKMAQGDYVGLLDHDDILLPGALFEIVKALNENGEADAIYTDEDKVSMDLNHHFQPHFKPDFNMEYLCSNNYICHFFVVRRELACRVGGFRSEYDGAQDHDFIFRCVEEAEEVLHIPKVLYSWRCHEASTANNPESKLYAYEAGKRAVSAHLERAGVKGEVLHTSNYGFYRIRFQKVDMEILINSFENLNGQSNIKVVYYGKVCNNSVIFSGTELRKNKECYMLFTCVQKEKVNRDFWDELLSCCARPEVGMVCARVYDKKRQLSSDISMAGVQDPFGKSMKGLKKGCMGYFHRALLQQELVEPTDCFLVKRELIEGLDDFTTQELCEKIKKQGYKIIYNPWAIVYEG